MNERKGNEANSAANAKECEPKIAATFEPPLFIRE
ncbi:hypothetical protein AB7M26_003160 [Pseudomonas sp. F-14 TE3482]|jgi:hypothetical protein